MPARSARSMPRLAVAVIGFCLTGVSMLFAGANFTENFDNNGPVNPGEYGPANLISRGWIFRTQSKPPSYYSATFFDGYLSWMSPQAGAGYLAVSYYPDPPGSGPVSQWGILPAVPGQVAGDPLTLWLSGMGPAPTQHIEVRYSAGGGTNTGSSPTDIGDFTQLLADVSPVPTGWTRLIVPLPGSGRIALRLVDQYVFGNGSPYVGIDTLSVGPIDPPPCNEPAFPDAGQTVTWSAANSPYEICTNSSIPAGGTVVVEPGVTVTVRSGFSLTVSGTLRGAGTPGAPIALNAEANYPAMLALREGTVDLQYVNIGGQIRPYSGCALKLTDATFAGLGLIWSNGTDAGPFPYVQPLIQLERCHFAGSANTATLTDCVSILRQVTATGGGIGVLRGYVDTTGGFSANGGGLSITFEAQIQPVYVDHVTVTGQANGPGLSLSGANFGLGPNNVLQNNLYPIEVRGGVWPGSFVPATGNTNNSIYFGNAGAQTHYARWANVGVPYRVDSFIDTPPLLIEAGSTVEFTPNALFRFRAGTPLLALGQPDAPITFKAAQPGQPWDVILFGSNRNSGRLEYCTVQGADTGVAASDALVWLDNVTFQNNGTGANANTYGNLVLRKTRFIGNGAGISFDDNGGLMMDAPSNPNSFEGNGAGIQTLGFYTQADARHTWWNSPTGPQSPHNPGGTGDPITGPGASGVQVVPFLTGPPDFTNHPPVVRLVRPSYLLTAVDAAAYYEPGQKVVLRWSATDDDTIAAQRVLVSPGGDWPAAFTLSYTVPANVRTYELTVPDVGVDPSFSLQYIRVVATDSRGQEGWDEIPCVISSGRMIGNVIFDVPGAGQTFYAGDPLPPYTRQVSGFEGWFPNIDDHLVYEADGSIYNSGGPVAQLPNVSTDLVRFWSKVYNNSNDVRWFPGPYITIRHDRRLGFQPPAVQLQTPAAGSSFRGGSVVPITWTAAAAEGFRSFDIQVSTDGGTFWRALVRDLPADARAYNWRLPASGGISDARVRVIVRDVRFQNSSDGTNRSFSILPGASLPGDLNCDGVVNFGDIDPFVLALSGQAAYEAVYPNCNWFNADVNGDGRVDFSDIDPFVALLTGG